MDRHHVVKSKLRCRPEILSREIEASATGASDMICRKLGVEPPIHSRRLAFFTKDRSFNTGKLREKLGYTMQHSNEEGLIETTRWYCAHGLLRARR